jgi:hypothetical protein
MFFLSQAQPSAAPGPVLWARPASNTSGSRQKIARRLQEMPAKPTLLQAILSRPTQTYNSDSFYSPATSVPCSHTQGTN